MTDVLEKVDSDTGSGSGSDEEDSDSVYEEEYYVEKIIDKRYNEAKGRDEYFIKWRGWPEESNTWEPVEHLENCPEILKKFERSHGQGGSLKKKKVNSKDVKVKGRRGEPPKIKFDFSKNKKRNLSINDLADTDDDDLVGGPGSTSTGFDRGLEPECVRHVTRCETSGELEIWMKWKGLPDLEKMPARIANEMCPQIVIRFYQNNIRWGTTDEEDPDCWIKLSTS